jgi:hypothetical protein
MLYTEVEGINVLNNEPVIIIMVCVCSGYPVLLSLTVLEQSAEREQNVNLQRRYRDLKLLDGCGEPSTRPHPLSLAVAGSLTL